MTTNLRMALIAIAQAFEAAGAAVIGHRLRSLPELGHDGARELWLERMREATTVAVDAQIRARRIMDDDGAAGIEKAAAAERYAIWGKAIAALDGWGRHIALQIGERDACALIHAIGKGRPEARAA